MMHFDSYLGYLAHLFTDIDITHDLRSETFEVFPYYPDLQTLYETWPPSEDKVSERFRYCHELC
jgi:hypothetical protein